MPITITVCIVLAMVVASGQQTLYAYPNGGGSYIVAGDTLGRPAGLTAAGALLTDYILTVSVSIAGVAALTSIFPDWFDYRFATGVGFVDPALPWQSARHARERHAVPDPYLRLSCVYLAATATARS